MTHRMIVEQRSNEAEADRLRLLEDLGALESHESIQNRTASPLKSPVEAHARHSQLVLALAKTVAEQRRDLDRLKKKVGESSGSLEAKPEESIAGEASKKKKGAKS